MPQAVYRREFPLTLVVESPSPVEEMTPNDALLMLLRHMFSMALPGAIEGIPEGMEVSVQGLTMSNWEPKHEG